MVHGLWWQVSARWFCSFHFRRVQLHPWGCASKISMRRHVFLRHRLRGRIRAGSQLLLLLLTIVLHALWAKIVVVRLRGTAGWGTCAKGAGVEVVTSHVFLTQ